MYSFRNVDKNNFNEVINLRIKDNQTGFLSSNLFSLAESKIFPEYIPLAIYFDEELIGFLVYNFIDEQETSIFLKRFMIDENYQGKGHGKKALLSLIEHFKSEFGIKKLELMHYPANKLAGDMYEKLGFKLTGEERFTDDIEVVREYLY